ncbi:hypothetical protein LOK49_LG01G02223 [Camellia lanceoleosa]|uniref:Uncharacterized protein n=1 Tax=Camellia lanceoleosa TaxID=1840588 RepID=A0ACC0IWQ2_9ERIC|nr:hypothetical protein LOK49_LG01G02223 [Camellia lanceoleosa]
MIIEEETEDSFIYQFNEIGRKTSTGGWFVSEGELFLLTMMVLVPFMILPTVMVLDVCKMKFTATICDNLVEEAAGGGSAGKSFRKRDKEGFSESAVTFADISLMLRFKGLGLLVLVPSLVLKQLSSMGRLVVCARNGAVQSTTNLGFATAVAMREGHLEILEILVKAGASQPACEEALLEASYHGHARHVELLMGSDLIRPHIAVHSLVTACSRGFMDVVDALIKCGVDTNATDRVLL